MIVLTLSLRIFAQEVSWPPAQQRTHSSANLKGTVPMGKARREMMDKEFEHVVQSTNQQHYASHPFTRGNMPRAVQEHTQLNTY